MASYTDPSFQERQALAAKARQKALDLLKAKPQLTEAELAERAAARAAKEAAEAERRAAKKAAMEAQKAERAAAKLAKAEAEAAAKPVELTDAEKKALRDERYAARKARKK